MRKDVAVVEDIPIIILCGRRKRAEIK